MKKIILATLATLLFAAVTVVAQQRAVIADNASISADRMEAESIDDGSPLTLSGSVQIQVGDDTLSLSDGSKYHPRRKVIETTFARSIEPLSGASISCSGDQVQVTFPDGTIALAGQLCSGTTRYTCSAGNLMQEVNSPSCQVP